MWFQIKVLVFLFTVCSLIAWCNPAGSGQLRVSAWRALEGSIRDLTVPTDYADDVPKARSIDEEPGPARRGSVAAKTPLPEWRSAGASVEKRARVTPYQAKRVAAAQGWRCGCGCIDPRDPQRRGVLLDETFEIDHVIPTRFGGAHDASNWVAKTRSHHQLKSALETQAAALRRR